MKRFITSCYLISTACLLSLNVHATPSTDYLHRFLTYQEWSQHLPDNPSPEFLNFIASDSPLSRKLREKWLYQLALKKDWSTFYQNYRHSSDLSLQCYWLIARYQQGQQTEAMKETEPLWLTGSSQPPACSQLFELFLNSNQFNHTLFIKRIRLALEKRNINLVNYLLKQYHREHEAQAITAIAQNPLRITQLPDTELHHDFYLYGLQRLVSKNMDKAIRLWEQVKNKPFFGESYRQAFFAQVALYKAMRDEPDTAAWFALVKPAYFNDVLVDWQLRHAIKHQQWKKVEQLIQQSPDKENPCWQYWLARALDEQHHKEQAHVIYNNLATTRNYYGFLASARLHQAPHFENEVTSTDISTLRVYQPITDQIKQLYLSHQTAEASRLVNDFVSELPKQEKSAFAYWLDKELQWHGKSVYLSNNEEMANQLTLRFPLAHQATIKAAANRYQIPPELMYAIIRQESGFRDDVVSPAGAHGLMQLMPGTAQKISKQEKIPYQDKKQLFTPQTNIRLGGAYLKELTKRYEKNLLLMIAAYNAGPQQVDYWLKNHHAESMDIWIETLPWPETRNYLKNVIAFYLVYQYRMQQKPDLSPFLNAI